MRLLPVPFAFMMIAARFCTAAFEPVPQSPWLQGGVSSSLFPRSPLALGRNPSALGLLECSGIAVSASRPFGLDRLDRSALAGAVVTDDWVAGGMLTASGDGSYAEITADAALALRLFPRASAGIGISICDLQISGYGRATGAAANISVAWSPAPGIYSTGIVRSIVRTELGASGDPAAPRSVEFAAGVVPSKEVSVSLGVAGQEGVDMEFTAQTSFSPADFMTLSSGIITDPVRFWAALEFSISSMGLQYGYGEHSSLPSTHSLALIWGDCAFRPETLDLTSEDEESEQQDPFPLNVNIASEQQLQLIPGIGPAKASAITAWIRMNGPVDSVDQLLEVPGVGPSLLVTLSDYLVAE